MRERAEELKRLAEVVALEAIHMEDAQKRFAERRGEKRERRAR